MVIILLIKPILTIIFELFIFSALIYGLVEYSIQLYKTKKKKYGIYLLLFLLLLGSEVYDVWCR
jgi:hypothetical protein